MKTLYLFVVMMFISALTGCGNQQPLVQYNNAFVAMPDNLLVNCTITPPPSESDLNTGTIDDTEQALFDLNLKQIKNLKVCNERLKAARDWQAKQKTLFNSTTTTTGTK